MPDDTLEVGRVDEATVNDTVVPEAPAPVEEGAGKVDEGSDA